MKKLLIAAALVGVVATVFATAASASIIPSYSSSYGYTPSYGLSSYYSPSYYSPTSYYGEINGAGFPKTQYVRPYFRSNGTYVQGYWRNSPNDGLPTCRIIRC
jgi:hypothetical protein